MTTVRRTRGASLLLFAMPRSRIHTTFSFQVEGTCPDFRGSRMGLWSLGSRTWCRADCCPAFVGRRAERTAPRSSADARAPWSKWRGPAPAGRRPFTPRKALAAARAALPSARWATDGGGALDMGARRRSRTRRLLNSSANSSCLFTAVLHPARLAVTHRYQNPSPLGWTSKVLLGLN